MSYWMLPFTFQLVLQSIVIIPFAIIFGKPARFKEGVLVLYWHEWFEKRWNYSTTLAFLMGTRPGHEDRASLWFHEKNVHVKQSEDLAVLSDILALTVYLVTGNWVLALCIWGTGGPLWQLPNFLTALRFRKAGKELGWPLWNTMYMFSEHERSAYAQTAQFTRNGGR